MEDLKIRVNNKSESKEAQELFFELEYSWNGNKIIQDLSFPVNGKYWLCTKNGMGLFNCIKWGTGHDSGKLITLPQLRDLVVLKRNDVGDANAFRHDNDVKYYITSDNKYYYFSDIPTFQWTESCNDIDYLEKHVKPIEKKEMKEYLRKNSNNTYSYIGTVRPEHVSDFMIEIPGGAEKLTACGLELIFWTACGNYSWHTENSVEWDNNKELGLTSFDQYFDNETVILWQRHTQPEALPFIDDEPPQSLNDQYAEIEKVRQSHRTASEIADSALKHIRERAETYDQPTGERSAAKTAKAFNAITGKDITESEVWLLLQLLKDVRQWSREDYHQDSAEDCIAYAALKAESLEGGE